MKRKIIGLNWKMNPKTLREAEALVRISREILNHDKVIFPPFPFIPVALKGRARIGAQNFSSEANGAHTGEVSLSMVKAFGAKYALVGHSERRAMGETDELINKKLRLSLQMGFIPVLCVGEPWSVRKNGTRVAEQFVLKQLKSAFHGLHATRYTKCVIAYEPVWAIGTGRACPPEDAVKMIRFIRQNIKDLTAQAGKRLKIIYGGSVDAKNVKSFLNEKEIDGVLVGGASSDLKKLRALVKNL